MSDLYESLRQAINSNSAENGSNTPDFILAGFLQRCLDAFDAAVKRRSNWYKPNLQSVESLNETPEHELSATNEILNEMGRLSMEESKQIERVMEPEFKELVGKPGYWDMFETELMDVLNRMWDELQFHRSREAEVEKLLNEKKPEEIEDHTSLLSALETAWGIIANAGNGDWKNESQDWQKAANRFRDTYHKILSSREAELPMEETETVISPEGVKRFHEAIASGKARPTNPPTALPMTIDEMDWPEEVKPGYWMAMDKDGSWFWYQTQPAITPECFHWYLKKEDYCESGWGEIKSVKLPPVDDWTQSLKQRPLEEPV